MGLRFRKTIRVLPGVRLNISKSGVSASVGPRGLTLNLGRRGAKGTVGLPGTGLSYSQDLRITTTAETKHVEASDADAGRSLLGKLAAWFSGQRS